MCCLHRRVFAAMLRLNGGRVAAAAGKREASVEKAIAPARDDGAQLHWLLDRCLPLAWAPKEGYGRPSWVRN